MKRNPIGFQMAHTESGATETQFVKKIRVSKKKPEPSQVRSIDAILECEFDRETNGCLFACAFGPEQIMTLYVKEAILKEMQLYFEFQMAAKKYDKHLMRH